MCVCVKSLLLFLENTAVDETLAVFSLSPIRKTGQCLDGRVGKPFLKIFG